MKTGNLDPALEKYTQLLTKKIIVDALAMPENRELYRLGSFEKLADECNRIYQQRLQKLCIDNYVSDGRKNSTQRAFTNQTGYMLDKNADGRTLGSLSRRYEESLKNDLAFAQIAFNSELPGKKVFIYTQDRDIKEFVTYVNAAKRAGLASTRNQVRLYVPAQAYQKAA